MKVAIIGGNGFVGTYLQKEFDEALIIGRKNFTEDIEKIKNYDVVINLAGATILHRWSEEYKKLLYSSRIDTTKKVVEVINQEDSQVKHFISTSAIGIYEDNCECDESKEVGKSFLAKLANDWEKEANKFNKTTTILRFGVVISKDGGALKQMLLPFKLGVGGPIGDGKMDFSFIDIRDLMKIYHFIIENNIEGTFNAVEPNPTTNYGLTKALGKVLHRPTIFMVPKFIIKLIFGEGSSVLLSSQKVYPTKLLKTGFKFDYDNIEKSLKSWFV
jgi:uncharacterized protein (TIGR01777 family)